MDNSVLDLLTRHHSDRKRLSQIDAFLIASVLEELFRTEEQDKYPDWEELGSVGCDLWLSGQTRMNSVFWPWLRAGDPRRWEIAAAFLEGYWTYSPPIGPEVLEFFDSRLMACRPGSGVSHQLLLVVCKLTRASLDQTRLAAGKVLEKWIDRGQAFEIQRARCRICATASPGCG